MLDKPRQVSISILLVLSLGLELLLEVSARLFLLSESLVPPHMGFRVPAAHDCPWGVKRYPFSDVVDICDFRGFPPPPVRCGRRRVSRVGEAAVGASPFPHPAKGGRARGPNR